MSIKTAAVIGLGALGTLYSDLLNRKMPKGDFIVIASNDRINRYRSVGVSINGTPIDLIYKSPQEGRPVDLIIFATKFQGLPSAIKDAAPFVGDNTLIISVLNGISSEELLIEAFGKEKVIHCVAWGMSAVKLGSNLESTGMGTTSIGEPDRSITPRLSRLTSFFDSIDFPYDTPSDIMFMMWSKLMLNVGLNQASAAFDCTYSGMQAPGQPRDIMISAMREVMLIANCEGIRLTEKDIDKWLAVLDQLAPDSSTSMRQDLLAGRKTELGLFAGTIIPLGKKHGIPTPVNEYLYDRISKLESMQK